MRRTKVILVFLTTVALLLTGPSAWADSISGDLFQAKPAAVTLDKAGFRMEVPPKALTAYSGSVKISEADLKEQPDTLYIIRPVDITMLDNQAHVVDVMPKAVRMCFNIDLQDFRRASRLNTNEPIGRFRIGFLEKVSNNWVQLSSMVFWDGEKGVVEGESDRGSGEFALLWSYEENAQLSPLVGEGIRLMVDYEVVKSSVNSYIKDGRTMVPLRVIAESLGAQVDWDSREQRIDIINDREKVQLWVGKNQMAKDGQSTIIDVAPEIVDSHTFVPLRVVSESLNANVTWDGVSRTAKVVRK